MKSLYDLRKLFDTFPVFKFGTKYCALKTVDGLMIIIIGFDSCLDHYHIVEMVFIKMNGLVSGARIKNFSSLIPFEKT